MRATATALRPAARIPLWIWPVLLGLLAMTRPVFGAGGVRDDAAFFTQAAVDSAEQSIKDISNRYHKDVVIETFPAIPDDKKSAFDAARKEEFFTNWAKERFGQDHVNGIYVLICKDPPFLKTEIGQKTVQRDFTGANGRELSTKMLAGFKAKRYDDALAAGTQYISSTLAQTMGTASQTAPAAATPTMPAGSQNNSYNPPVRMNTGTGFGLPGIVMLVVVAMIVIAIIRRALRGSSSYGGPGWNGGGTPGYQQPGPGFQQPGYGGGYGGGGGGFGRGILGGLLGGAAGGYLYDRFNHRDDNNSAGNAFPGQQTSGGLPNDNDQGIASGQDTGGGFFGGGDTGGGTDSSGGGDFGGGGGDSGGGDNSGGGSF